MANGSPAPENALAYATGSAQAATTCSRDDRLTAGLSAE